MARGQMRQTTPQPLYNFTGIINKRLQLPDGTTMETKSAIEVVAVLKLKQGISMLV